MIRCANCGHTELAGALFCSDCGANLIGTEDTSSGDSDDMPSQPKPPSMAKDTSGQEAEKPTIQLAPRNQRSDLKVTVVIVDAGTSIPLEGANEFTLGRVSKGQPLIPEIDLSPYDAYEQGVSRLHAVIGIRELKITITDLGSANGTRVNGVRIPPHTPQPLENGDLVTLGRLKIQTFIR